ncbi:hypothetical protein ACFLZP_04655 [Patescibacteria group bacterium]
MSPEGEQSLSLDGLLLGRKAVVSFERLRGALAISVERVAQSSDLGVGQDLFTEGYFPEEEVNGSSFTLPVLKVALARMERDAGGVTNLMQAIRTKKARWGQEEIKQVWPITTGTAFLYQGLLRIAFDPGDPLDLSRGLLIADQARNLLAWSQTMGEVISQNLSNEVTRLVGGAAADFRSAVTAGVDQRLLLARDLEGSDLAFAETRRLRKLFGCYGLRIRRQPELLAFLKIERALAQEAILAACRQIESARTSNALAAVQKDLLTKGILVFCDPESPKQGLQMSPELALVEAEATGGKSLAERLEIKKTSFQRFSTDREWISVSTSLGRGYLNEKQAEVQTDPARRFHYVKVSAQRSWNLYYYFELLGVGEYQTVTKDGREGKRTYRNYRQYTVVDSGRIRIGRKGGDFPVERCDFLPAEREMTLRGGVKVADLEAGVTLQMADLSEKQARILKLYGIWNYWKKL